MANKPQYSYRGHPNGHVLGIIASKMNQEVITARNLAIDIKGFQMVLFEKTEYTKTAVLPDMELLLYRNIL